jgi:hypothetical protein
MISEKQLEANRTNAQKSTGPRTEAGKKRSSLNALRHGLTGQTVVLPEEDLAAHHAFLKGIVESFSPADANETQLAQSYAEYQWRLNRIAAIETTMFTLGIMEDNAGNLNLEDPQVHNAVSYAKTFRSQSGEFGRLSMYNQRLENSAAKVLKQLKELQAERHKRDKYVMDDAVQVYRLNKMLNIPFDPSQNGFALTVDQIREYIRRQNQKFDALEAKQLDYDKVAWTQRRHNAAA